MFTLPSAPQDIGQTLDTGFKLFTAGLKNALVLAVLMAGLLVVFSGIAPDAPAPGADPDALAQYMDDLGTFGLVSLLLLPLSTILFIAMVATYNGVALGERLGLGGALMVGLKKLFPLILWSILYMVLIVLGYVALIIPGIILTLSLMFGMYSIVLENKGPFAAIGRSHRLVWGNWWRTFLFLSLVYILTTVVYIALLFPLAFLVGMMAPEDPSLAGIVFLAIYGLLTVFVMPLTVALSIALYYDLRARKEGGDLEARIEAAVAPA